MQNRGQKSGRARDGGDYKGKGYLLYTKEQLHVRTLSGYEHARDLRADQNLTRIEELDN